MKILIVGGVGGTNIGESFLRAANELDLEATVELSRLAYEAPKPLRIANWYLRRKYPTNLVDFSQNLIELCDSSNYKILLTTGIAPVSRSALKKVGDMGIKRINFLTDDPWNPAHYAPWFLKALPFYDFLFSPRRSNIKDLLSAGCPRVEYLPFGYDHTLFFSGVACLNNQKHAADIIFAGGADADRVPYMHALIQADLDLNLYGSYWEKYPETRNYTFGQVDAATLRKTIINSKVALCLVRRANRDGNCMRTFEVPAIGTCMLTEDTFEHREIFGLEGEAVVYFNTVLEMVDKARWLLEHEEERQRLAQKAHLLITQGKNTYTDRLKTILSFAC